MISPTLFSSSSGGTVSALTHSRSTGATFGSVASHSDACTPPSSSRTSERRSVVGVRSAEGGGSGLRGRGDRVASGCIELFDGVIIIHRKRHAQVLSENRLDLANRPHRVKLLAQIRRAWQALYVPSQMLPELYRRTARIQFELICHMRVFQCDRKAIAHWWCWTLGSALEQIARLVEYPRLAE